MIQRQTLEKVIGYFWDEAVKDGYVSAARLSESDQKMLVYFMADSENLITKLIEVVAEHYQDYEEEYGEQLK